MILDRLNEGVVLGDGGALFELERRGYLSAGPFTPEVVLDNPEALHQLQVDFARAGAQVLQALTYYAHEEKLAAVGRRDFLKQVNADAVSIARKVAAEYGIMVAGNLSNTWVFNPSDSSSFSETRRQFDDQIAYQELVGVDFFIAETMEYLGEARIALEAIIASGKPAMITLGFKYGDKTLDGFGLEEAFSILENEGAHILGINCFRDPDRMLPLAQRLVKTVSCPVAAQPVAYRCTDEQPYFQARTIEGRPAFPLEMDSFTLSRLEMARFAEKAKETGIRYIGGCCGTGPHHLRAMAEALGMTTPNSKYSPRIELHPIIGDDTHVREKDQRILCEQRYGPNVCHFLGAEKP
jgi:betaine-homocysteine S-methyltransferase